MKLPVQRLTQSVPLVVREVTHCGLGLLTSGSLPKGTFICLYAGEVLSTSEARHRWSAKPADNYTLSLRLNDDTLHIDPRYRGNAARWMNHSCDPNCIILVVYWGVDAVPRAAVFVSGDASQELTADQARGTEGRRNDV